MDESPNIHAPTFLASTPIAPAPAPPPALPAMAPDGFTPRCTKCKYDLSGLPDGPCPECGQPFSLSALIAAALVKEKLPPGNLYLALGLSLAAAPFFWYREAYLQIMILSIMWCLTLAWLGFRRKRLANQDVAHLLWIIIPIIRTVAVILETSAALPAAIVGLIAIAAVAAFTYARNPIATVRSLTIGYCLPMFVVSIWLLVPSISGLAGGHYWSYLDYPFWSRFRYPFLPRTRVMPNLHVLYAGSAALVMTVLPFVLGARILRNLSRAELPACTSSGNAVD